MTKADGSTATFTQQDNNTDTKVTQTLTSTSAVYPFLLAPTGQTATTTTTSLFASGMGINASTGALSGVTLAWSSITGKPSYYDAKAITSITRSGTTFTYTCLDGTTGTFTQQDNNTDTKVTNTLATTTQFYITGTSSSSTNTGTQYFDTGVYVSATAGNLYSTSYTLGSGTADMTAGTLKFDVINIPTSSGGTTYGAGTSGYVLKTNGTTVYWGADNNTTYSAGTGISLSGTTFSNSGVRSIATGSTNGTISVNTNGTSADVAVKGLGSNAYTSTAYLPLAGGTMTGGLTLRSNAYNYHSDTTSYGLNCSNSDICQVNSIYTADLADGATEGIHFYNTSTTWDTVTAKSGTFYFIANHTGSVTTLTGSATIQAGTVYGAVWNDYAEFRATKEEIEAGRVVVENGDDTLSLATERLMPGANVVSDTFGFAIGETETSKTPLAVSGRALVYPYEDRDSYKPGDPVCSGPNGTVSKMTRKEVMQYPDRMIGTVSAIPDYNIWGTGNVEVNGRIWIKIL